MAADNLTSAVYSEIITYLVTKARTALPSVKVIETPTYFASPQDFAAFVGDSYVKPYKCKYLIFSYGTFRDSPNKGCDDDPDLFVTFRMQLYRTVQERRAAQSNSHDLLVTDFIALRNAFLINRDIRMSAIVHNALTQTGDMVNAGNSEYIVGDVGDWMNFRVEVEIHNG